MIRIVIAAWVVVFCQVWAYSQVVNPSQPDYADLVNWAAHPQKEDPADRVPEASLPFLSENRNVDVFFVHPTTFTKGKPTVNWNGDLRDDKLRQKTLETTILNQASIFNGAGRVYAPFYRQAHLHAYFTKNKSRANQAFELAYADVKAAFEYYLENENQGRPIIMAAHSQGTNHTERLLKEFFDQDPSLRSRLVAAYLVGMPVAKDAFNSIPPCERKDQMHCFCSWRTFKSGHLPKKRIMGDSISVTNPISWNTSKAKVDKDQNLGSVLRDFDAGFIDQLVGAQIKEGLLWVDKPKFPGSILLTTKNYHIADFNLFYESVRENSMLRASKYYQK